MDHGDTGIYQGQWLAGMWQLEAVFWHVIFKVAILQGFIVSYISCGAMVFSHQKWDETKLMKLIQELRSMYVDIYVLYIRKCMYIYICLEYKYTYMYMYDHQVLQIDLVRKNKVIFFRA